MATLEIDCSRCGRLAGCWNSKPARGNPSFLPQVQVLLDLRRDRVVANESFLQEPALDSATLESQLALIRSTVLLKRVVERERLIEDPEFGFVPTEKPTVLQIFASYFSVIDPRTLLAYISSFSTPPSASSDVQPSASEDVAILRTLWLRIAGTRCPAVPGKSVGASGATGFFC